MVPGRLAACQQHLGYGHGPHRPARRVSYSQLYSRSDAVRISNFQTRNGTYSNNNSSGTPSGICRAPLPSSSDTSGFPPIIPSTGQDSPCYGAASAGADGFADFLQGNFYSPVGGQFQTETHDRKRRGIAAAAQWQSNDRRALVTAQFLNSRRRSHWVRTRWGSAPIFPNTIRSRWGANRTATAQRAARAPNAGSTARASFSSR